MRSMILNSKISETSDPALSFLLSSQARKASGCLAILYALFLGLTFEPFNI